MTIRIQVREYSKVVYALHTFSQEYQIALPEEHCSSLFRNKKLMLDEIVDISQWSTEPKQDSVIFGFRFGSARFGSFRFFQKNRTEYLQDKIKY